MTAQLCVADGVQRTCPEVTMHVVDTASCHRSCVLGCPNLVTRRRLCVTGWLHAACMERSVECS